MTPLPRKREEILKDLLLLSNEAHPTAEGQITKAICLLAEVILDKEQYDTIDIHDRAN